MNNEDSDILVTVYTTWNHAIISIIKSMLDEAEIQYLAKGENLQYMEPIAAFPVEFQVLESDAEFARELLKDVVVTDGSTGYGYEDNETDEEV